MGLLSIARAAVKIGMAAAGDAKLLITIKTGPTITHNTATDTSTVTWAHTNVLAAFVYDTGEGAGEPGGPKKQVKTAFVDANDPLLTAAPTEESKITVDGFEYEVVSLEQDPAKASFIIGLGR